MSTRLHSALHRRASLPSGIRVAGRERLTSELRFGFAKRNRFDRLFWYDMIGARSGLDKT